MSTDKAPPMPGNDQPFLTLAQQLEKTPPCQAQCPNSGDVRGWLGIIAQRDKLGIGLEEACDRVLRDHRQILGAAPADDLTIVMVERLSDVEGNAS